MNIKKIIREEVNDFDWIHDTKPIDVHAGPWIIIYNTDEEHIEAQEWLFTQGYQWRDNSTNIITGLNDKDHQEGFLFSGMVGYDEVHGERYYPHSDNTFEGYSGIYGMDMLEDVIKSPSTRTVYKWSEDIKPYV